MCSKYEESTVAKASACDVRGGESSSSMSSELRLLRDVIVVTDWLMSVDARSVAVLASPWEKELSPETRIVSDASLLDDDKAEL